jgi:hypothetical protein
MSVRNKLGGHAERKSQVSGHRSKIQTGQSMPVNVSFCASDTVHHFEPDIA